MTREEDEALLAKIDDLVGREEDETVEEHEARVAAMARLKEARIIRRGTIPH